MDPHTLLSGIEKLPSGCCARVEDGATGQVTGDANASDFDALPTGIGLGDAGDDSPSVSESCCDVGLDIDSGGVVKSETSTCTAPCAGELSIDVGPSMSASMEEERGGESVRRSSSGGHVARTDL